MEWENILWPYIQKCAKPYNEGAMGSIPGWKDPEEKK